MGVNRTWLGRMGKSRLIIMVNCSTAVKRDPFVKFIARCHAVTFPQATHAQSVGFNVRIYPVRDGALVISEGKLVFIAAQGEISQRQVKAETERNRINRWLREIYRLSDEVQP